MSWTSAVLSAAEIAAWSADKPLLIATSIIDRATLGDRARWNTVGDFDTADAGDASAPTYLLTNRSSVRLSSPSSAEATWYIVLDGSAGGAGFDAIYLEHEDLEAVADLTITAEVSNASSFPSPVDVSFAGTIARGRILSLLTYLWSGSGFFRLALTSSAPFVPKIRKLWVGRRRQLRRSAERPVDFDRVVSRSSRTGTISGDGIVEYSGRGDLRMTLIARDSDDTLLDSETLTRWWAETNGGQLASILVPAPLSAPNRARVVRMPESAYALSRESWGERKTDLAFRELPPFLGLP